MSGSSAIRLIENSKNKQCSAEPNWIAKNRQMLLQSNEDKWNAMYDELKKYILEDKDVPPQLQKLGRWMNNQRKWYRNKSNGEPPALSDERERKLNELEGFEWVGTKGKPTK